MSEQSGLLREGFRRTWRYQRVLWWIFFINLAFGLFGTMPTLTKLEDIGHSARSQRLTNMFDYGAWSELTSDPEVDPFAAQGGSLHFGFVFFFFMLFLTGGILEAYRADRKLTTREFFEECGNYFWRWVRLLILMLVVMIPVVMVAIGARKLFSKLETPNEKLPYWILFAGLLLACFLWMCVRLWFDMAQVRAVAEEEYRMWRNARQAFRLTFSNFGSLFWLYFRISLVWWVIFALGFWIWTKMPPARFEWTTLVLEFVILTGFGTRLWQRASEMVWYQRRFLTPVSAPFPVTPAPDPMLAVAPGQIPPQP